MRGLPPPPPSRPQRPHSHAHRARRRDPRWGRGPEVAGEDPLLVAEYINEYARGLQEGEDSRYTKLISTAK